MTILSKHLSSLQGEFPFMILLKTETCYFISRTSMQNKADLLLSFNLLTESRDCFDQTHLNS